MRAVVTGGAGFIGSHVVDRLIDDGHDVLIIDDMSSGREANLNAAAMFTQSCITTSQSAACIQKFAPHRVFHLAAQMDVRVSIDKPVFDATVNVAGTVNVVEAARRGGALEKVVFASTGGAIYGDTDVFPTPERAPTLPDSAYGTAKLCAEQYLGWFSRLYKIPYAAMRFGNVYGPRQNPHGEAGVIAIFAGRLRNGERCTIFGDGTNARDYVYVGDVVTAFVGAALNDAAEGAYNIGTGIETTVNELYTALRQCTNSNLAPTHAPARPGESARSVLECSRARADLGWTPEVHLNEGLRRVWNYVSASE